MEHFCLVLRGSPSEMLAKPWIENLSCLRVCEAPGTPLAFLSFPCLPFEESVYSQ